MATVQSRDGKADAQHLFGKPARQREKGTGEVNSNEELRASPWGMLLLQGRLVLSQSKLLRVRVTSNLPPWIFLQGSFSSRHRVHLAAPGAV